jgi:hypothetical protein
VTLENNRPWQLDLVPCVDEMVAEYVVHIPEEEPSQEHQDARKGQLSDLAHALVTLGGHTLAQRRFHVDLGHIEAADRR